MRFASSSLIGCCMLDSGNLTLLSLGELVGGGGGGGGGSGVDVERAGGGGGGG